MTLPSIAPRPQTIQIFLPGGDPRGIRVAEITTRIVQVIEVPRSLLAHFLKMEESTQVAVYFLVSQGSDTEDPKAYIGQTSDMRLRFATHNRDKDFWERALVMVSRTHSLTQTHALFLEWLCLQEAKSAARYITTNGNVGSRPHTPKPLEADCLEIFETTKSLVSVLGHPIFEPAKPADVNQEAELLFLRTSGCEGRGYYTEEGFVVLQGSAGRRESVPSIKGTTSGSFRERLIESGVLAVKGERVVATKDHIFGSPSMAAVALAGRTANGWNEWKNAAGKTLHELKRAAVEGSAAS